jgi:hypothetical protein
MVSISMAVSATDDSGISLVKLVSITCDDGCDAATDVAGAAFGTDDRTFQLRSDRKKGRVYTITYEAVDVAGNRATASAKILVPHDQKKE